MNSTGHSLQKLQVSLTEICTRCGRDPSSVTLVGIAKTKPATDIRQVVLGGLKDIGENYVQEMLGKMDELKDLSIRWHFVGHLQSRKASLVAGRVTLIHSLDSLSLATALEKSLSGKSLVQDCLLQINLSEEHTKSGIPAEKGCSFLEQVSSLTHVKVRGLMTLPPFFNNPEKARPYFARLRKLLDEINVSGCYREKLTTLSMGMSHDFEVAIEEGATLIRIGTALFGERLKKE